jgi:phenylalanyl-tRNA synthetase alpha chain
VHALSLAQLRRALAIRDLTDPADGAHAMQIVIDDIVRALTERWAIPAIVSRSSPVVSIADNYDHLNYPPDGVSRDARYTRYVCDSAVLRSQTSAAIPALLRTPLPGDVLLACPGMCYRRDAIDRLHVGEPHQIDLWRIATQPLGVRDLDDMIATVVAAALPGAAWRTQPASHPYTTNGLQIDVSSGDDWIEIGECGLAALVPSGLAMGLGLDRLLMLRKGIDDIRLLRASDPRIASQMLDLAPYRPVSTMPPVRRDLSIVVDAVPLVEELGDRVRGALGERADLLESLELVSVTPHDALPAPAVARLGIAPGQHNVLVRLTLRAIDRSLTHAECNALRDEVYAAIHRGSVHAWASRRGW